MISYFSNKNKQELNNFLASAVFNIIVGLVLVDLSDNVINTINLLNNFIAHIYVISSRCINSLKFTHYLFVETVVYWRFRSIRSAEMNEVCIIIK